MRFDSNAFRITDKIRKNILVSTDQGMFIVNRFDKNKNNDGQGIWLLDHGNVSTVEAQLTFNLLNTLQPIVIDVGANIGTYTSWVAMNYPQGTIYSLEPQRLVFQMLCGNLAINNFENVFAYNLALGNEDRYIEISEPDYSIADNFGSYSLLSNFNNLSGKKSKVEMLKLDTFVNRFNIPKLDLLKIDCEGMDFTVLLGAEQTIKNFMPCIIVEYFNDVLNQKKEILDFLNNFNYNIKEFQHNIIATVN
jgi:FkbM family methyltransferase